MQRDVSEPNGGYLQFTSEEIKELLIYRLKLPQVQQSVTLQCSGKQIYHFMNIFYDEE